MASRFGLFPATGHGNNIPLTLASRSRRGPLITTSRRPPAPPIQPPTQPTSFLPSSSSFVSETFERDTRVHFTTFLRIVFCFRSLSRLAVHTLFHSNSLNELIMSSLIAPQPPFTHLIDAQIINCCPDSSISQSKKLDSNLIT